MKAHDKARVVAGRVTARVREVAPPGLGHWDLAWELVAQPSDVFMDALADWRAEDSFTTRMALEAASTVLVAAWAEAARQWEEAGRPTHGETDDVEVGAGELVS